MPDFTVIDGGGEKRDWDREISQQHFEDFILALLRGLASGDQTYRAKEQFFQFLEHAQKTQVPIGPVIDGAIKELHGMAFNTENVAGYEYEQIAVTQAALLVIVECMAKDNLAKARLSKREDSLGRSIERKVLSSEVRSRENGWSYVENLTKHLGKWSPRKK